MVIRPYEKKDREELVQIWFDSTVTAHSFIPKEKWEAHKDDIRNQYLPRARTWIAEEAGRLVGFISLADHHIGALFIAPNWQGKGFGSGLINFVKAIENELTVGVYKKNERARKFYEQHDFKFKDEELQEETGEIVLNLTWAK